MSTKGAAFGITLARDILFRYQNLSVEEKNKFLIEVNEKYKPATLKIDEAIKKYSDKQDDYSILNLSKVASGIRKELFVRLNMAPNGTSEIVSLREDLLKLMKDKPELKRRLGKDRRFFAYFHPALEDEPIIFVEIALTKGLSQSIQELTRPSDEKIKNYDTATIYSISNCQDGLSRVTLGNFLIKRVVYELQEELPDVKYFGTLSPMVGFADWFKKMESAQAAEILGEANKNSLDFLKSSDLKIGDKRIADNKALICKLAVNYLAKQKNDFGFPINDVCRFHLKNGADIDDIAVNANVSEVGFKRSFGVMVNYRYELAKIEKNHQEYVNEKKVNISNKVKKHV